MTKKALFTSYLAGITDTQNGESYATMLRYFFPELISSLVLYSVLYLIDAHWISQLQSTATYATVGTTNTLIHLIIKIAEGFSVGVVVITGRYNGTGQTDQIRRAFVSALWANAIVGGIIAGILYFGAYWIYVLYRIPPKMIQLGIPLLQLKSISIFLMFVFFAVIGFLRGIKRPHVPMILFILGAFTFLFFDYALIFGKFGFPELRLRGSAIASIIQYFTMLCGGLWYIIFDQNSGIKLSHFVSEPVEWKRVYRLIRLSIPIALDKAVFALGYLWLGAMINPMGKYTIASYAVIRDLERLAIQPAAAFAHVITSLVSNAYVHHNWQGIKSTIKKGIFISSCAISLILVFFSLKPMLFIHFFDPKEKFTLLASSVLPILSVFAFCDLLQLILSGALRGAADVKIVLWVRLGVLLLYFAPTSWIISQIPIDNPTLKFMLIYATFYIGNGLMSIVYINRFRGTRWQEKTLERTNALTESANDKLIS